MAALSLLLCGTGNATLPVPLSTHGQPNPTHLPPSGASGNKPCTRLSTFLPNVCSPNLSAPGSLSLFSRGSILLGSTVFTTSQLALGPHTPTFPVCMPEPFSPNSFSLSLALTFQPLSLTSNWQPFFGALPTSATEVPAYKQPPSGHRYLPSTSASNRAPTALLGHSTTSPSQTMARRSLRPSSQAAVLR
jgi:hypothetical protein